MPLLLASGEASFKREVKKVNLSWVYNQKQVDWQTLSELYRRAPLGEKSPRDLETVFSRSMFKCFVYDADTLVGAGRVLADGADCAYLCDVAVHPAYQGRGVGRGIVEKLVSASTGHKKIILYANPGKEGFYEKLGFRRMKTAMAIFRDREAAVTSGVIV